MGRKGTHIQADIATTQAWMRITGTPDWKLLIEDLCSRVFFNPPSAKESHEGTMQLGEQRLLRSILSRSSPTVQRSILERLTEEALSDGD